MGAGPAASKLTYSELSPPGDLSRWIACFWQIRGECALDSGAMHRVLPDGCGDLLLDLAAERLGRHAASISGPMTRAHVFELTGSVDFVGVRFRPGAVGFFAGVDAAQLLDARVPFGDTANTGQYFVEALAELNDLTARAARLIAIGRARFAIAERTDPAVESALARLGARRAFELPRISVLARDVGLSERALERRFAHHVGFTPVRFRRLARFRAALRAHAVTRQEWAQIALDTGFSDQAHLTRDFREFAGITPIEWAHSQRAPAGFLQDGRLTAL
jgi:AraC-like DNA-binding protein